ncbi:MAG: CapA family protein [Candidatus Saccharibacteria bacterium]|nr:CapA family protein [Candidatus Saccharibacteria bacterium]
MKRKTLGIIVIIGLLVAAGFVAMYYYADLNSSTSDESVTKKTPANSEELQFETVEGRYLLSGTIVPARGVEQQAFGDPMQPFSRLDTFSPEKYDAWSVDFECPVTDRQLSFREQVNTLTFNCPPKFMPGVTKYFNLINLANNHSGDLGEEAFRETQERFDETESQAFGHYDPAVKDETCRVVDLPVRLQMSDGAEQASALPFAFCAWHYFLREPQPGELEVMEDYAEVMPVFAFTHSGLEYYATAQSDQVELNRKLIDLGAEFVIGNNPHWVQNTEAYKDKLIVYSTGNFIFDQLDKETNRAANIDVTMKLDYTDNIKRWVELGDKCEAHKRINNCLEMARDQRLEKFNPDFEFDMIASVNGYKIVTERAPAEVQRAVEERMNWQQTLQQLR